ncbi:MAG: DUF2281 domain-containing protein [Gammaproteobacteria bacterium]|nr:DUF2281 domain-containing protein [Gammaproteobacteria bacterium]MCF6363760.1 DUF2281 domain-containing protein [Gammaproteobacteria bacterium]
MIEKIQLLPTDRIAEVEDFVDFLRERAKQRKTTSVVSPPTTYCGITSHGS